MNNRPILPKEKSKHIFSMTEEMATHKETYTFIDNASWIKLYSEIEKTIRATKEESQIKEVRIALDIDFKIGTSSTISPENFMQLTKDLQNFANGLKTLSNLKKAKKQNNNLESLKQKNSAKTVRTYIGTYTIYLYPSEDAIAVEQWLESVKDTVDLLSLSKNLYWINNWRTENKDAWLAVKKEFAQYLGQYNNEKEYEDEVKNDLLSSYNPLTAEHVRNKNIDFLYCISQNLKNNQVLKTEEKDTILNVCTHFHTRATLNRSTNYLISKLKEINQSYNDQFFFPIHYKYPPKAQIFVREKGEVRNDMQKEVSNESKNLITKKLTQDTTMVKTKKQQPQELKSVREETKNPQAPFNGKDEVAITESNKNESSPTEIVKTGEVLTGEETSLYTQTSPALFIARIAKKLNENGANANDIGELAANFFLNFQHPGPC